MAGTSLQSRIDYKTSDGILMAADVFITLTGDGTGNWPSPAFQADVLAATAGMHLESVEYQAGSPAPNTFGITLLTAFGNDLLGAQAASVAASPKYYIPYPAAVLYKGVPRGKSITLNVSLQQTIANAVGNFTFHFVK